jgi:FdrA protein
VEAGCLVTETAARASLVAAAIATEDPSLAGAPL